MSKLTSKPISIINSVLLKEISKNTGLKQYKILDMLIANAYELMQSKSQLSKFDNKKISKLLLTDLKAVAEDKRAAEYTLLSIRKKEKKIKETLKTMGVDYEQNNWIKKI